MRAYLIDGGGKKKYVGTQAEVSTFKKKLLAEGLTRKDITVEEVDIPDDKQGKLDFINNILNSEK
jgi:hypothetical protein